METIISSVVAFVVALVLTIAILAWRHRGQRGAWEAEYRHKKATWDAYWGVNARVDTLTAEEIAQAEKDRQDFLSLVSGPHLGTAIYNTAQEQAMLEGARRFAAAEGVSLREGLQIGLRRQASLNRGTATFDVTPGTVTPEQRASASELWHQARLYTGGTPDPKEYRP